ncbi:hypothetical protein Bca52824_057924 [Brassica carinata]|uniref:Uncharacterized protein n=1 Tax=Brassica carinata TaxID=52824 RepID=A0A8X7UE89_BRACI|nr:hypothetical protein Bca52824_057924 [Brassica carinata]
MQQLIRSQKVIVHYLLQEIYVRHDLLKTSFAISCGLLLLPLLLQKYQHVQVAICQSLFSIVSCETIVRLARGPTSFRYLRLVNEPRATRPDSPASRGQPAEQR